MMPNFNFKNIKIWDPHQPEKSFSLLPADGRIPSTRLEHWRDFTSLVESEYLNFKDHQYIFRGHRRSDWLLTSTLGRLTANGFVTKELMQRQLMLFRKSIRGRVKDHALFEEGIEDNELWSIGQHHGLMTPLLDWSYSPYVSLFFAFADEDIETETENEYRAVYFMNKEFIDKLNASEDNAADLALIEPKKDDFGRLVSQAGLFILSPTDAGIENKIIDALSYEYEEDDSEWDTPENVARYICKVYIKNSEQKECLKYLRRMNIHHASLFPDLLGAAQYCNILIREDDDRYAEAKSEGQTESLIVTNNVDHLASYEINVDESVTTNIFNLLNHGLTAYDSNKLMNLSKNLHNEIEARKVLDWDTLDNIRESMLAVTRILLRKYDYPEAKRADVLENILKVIAQGEKS